MLSENLFHFFCVRIHGVELSDHCVVFGKSRRALTIRCGRGTLDGDFGNLSLKLGNLLLIILDLLLELFAFGLQIGGDGILSFIALLGCIAGRRSN